METMENIMNYSWLVKCSEIICVNIHKLECENIQLTRAEKVFSCRNICADTMNDFNAVSVTESN